MIAFTEQRLFSFRTILGMIFGAVLILNPLVSNAQNFGGLIKECEKEYTYSSSTLTLTEETCITPLDYYISIILDIFLICVTAFGVIYFLTKYA